MSDGTRLVAQRYRLQERIGSGAMGVVWRAHDERLDRVVAVKQLLMQPGLAPHEADEAIARAMREARIAARLQHPHAIGVFDVALDAPDVGRAAGEVPWLIMEYLPSRSLATALLESGPLPPREVARIGRQVADALTAAHRAGIVHRDVKPGNILLGENGTVKITDFGISRASWDVTVTRTGVLAGTPAYFAPEVARGERPGPASDVFSLGSTLYTAVEGVPPFGLDDNTLALLRAVADGRINPPRHAGPLGRVLVQLLQADPALRPPMAEAVQALGAVASGGGASPAGPVRRGRGRVVAVPALGALRSGGSTGSGRPTGAPGGAGAAAAGAAVAGAAAAAGALAAGVGRDRPAEHHPVDPEGPAASAPPADAPAPADAPHRAAGPDTVAPTAVGPAAPTATAAVTVAPDVLGGAPTAADRAGPASRPPADRALDETAPAPRVVDDRPPAAGRDPLRRRAALLVAAAAVLLLLGVVAITALTRGADPDPTAGAAPAVTSSAPAEPSTTAGTPTSAEESADGGASGGSDGGSGGDTAEETTTEPTSTSDAPTAAAPADGAALAREYYGLLPGDIESAYAYLGPGFRARVPFERYARFWNQFSAVSVVGEPTVDGGTVVVPLRYVRQNGTELTEDKTLFVDGRTILGDDVNPVQRG